MVHPDTLLLRHGDHGPRVRALRDRLAAVGHPTPTSADPDRFDDALADAVRTFQQRRDLISDGIVGLETSRALDGAHWHLGDRILRHLPGHLLVGDDVIELQERLIGLGFLADRPDGHFGPRTEHALQDLQRSVGLTPDGTCGPDTLRALAQISRTVTGGNPTALRERDWVASTGASLVGRVVVIDPGHGGTDTGATGHGLTEADVVLDLAHRLEGRLAAAGVTAVLTRGADQDPTLTERADLAAAVRADLVLSLHCDAHTDPAASGIATFYWAGGRHRSVIGERLAHLVHRELLARTDLPDCHVHGRRYHLLQITRMPAVRVELGYLTHPGDARRLADPAFRDECAQGLLAAVQRLLLPEDDDVATGTLDLAALRARLAADGLDDDPARPDT